jgi:hypothetical protein
VDAKENGGSAANKTSKPQEKQQPATTETLVIGNQYRFVDIFLDKARFWRDQPAPWPS